MNSATNHDVKGWCPSAHKPMESGDGLIVRVNPPLGQISSVQLSSLADLSEKYGNRTIDLTRRASLQIRGVSKESYSGLLDELALQRLAGTSEVTAGFVNIVLAPFYQDNDFIEKLWFEINHLLGKVAGLPSKFGVIIDAGEFPCLKDIPGDIRVERSADQELMVRLDGCEKGIKTHPDELANCVRDIAEWFSTSTGIVDGRGRIGNYVQNKGSVPQQFYPNADQLFVEKAVKSGLTDQGCFAAFPFGQVTSDQLKQLADLGHDVALTPWRMILIKQLHTVPAIDGAIFEDCNLLSVDACVGKPYCFQAKQATREVAARLATKLKNGQSLHISGCTKGCARGVSADYTFVGTDDGFDLVKNGKPADQPVKQRIPIDQLEYELEAQIGA